MENEKNKWRGDHNWCAAKLGRDWEVFVQEELRVSAFRWRTSASVAGAVRILEDSAHWVEDAKFEDEDMTCSIADEKMTRVWVRLPLGDGKQVEASVIISHSATMGLDYDRVRNLLIKQMLAAIAWDLVKHPMATENWRCA